MTSEYFSDTDIAIIGIAGKFPDADNVTQYWQNICNKKNSIKLFSETELNQAGVDKTLYSHLNYVKRKGYLDSALKFDADFFGYNE
ncbi:MAG: beta-ketoacyl synthase N-terminal-like domain-containing protein, partial [Gammaproteobacteria bacterium]